ncbi:GNAT family N-acetyltransferase [Streptomyces sp. NPDC018057]|uniref:GNAT family N-acetyltransferase n=1 Tax=unclassified Streptomyces TaxID=2593676 RepID=UPI00379BC3E9
MIESQSIKADAVVGSDSRGSGGGKQVNVRTLPAYRRHGIGRAVTGTILHEASAAGTHTAYLHSSDEAVPLFAHLGLRTEETRTAFTA